MVPCRLVPVLPVLGLFCSSFGYCVPSCCYGSDGYGFEFRSGSWLSSVYLCAWADLSSLWISGFLRVAWSFRLWLRLHAVPCMLDVRSSCCSFTAGFSAIGVSFGADASVLFCSTASTGIYGFRSVSDDVFQAVASVSCALTQFVATPSRMGCPCRILCRLLVAGLGWGNTRVCCCCCSYIGRQLCLACAVVFWLLLPRFAWLSLLVAGANLILNYGSSAGFHMFVLILHGPRGFVLLFFRKSKMICQIGLAPVGVIAKKKILPF